MINNNHANKRDRIIGLSFAFGAAWGLSLYTILIKFIADEQRVLPLSFMIFFSALCYSLPTMVVNGVRGQGNWNRSRSSLFLLLGFAFILLIGNISMMVAVALADPALVAVVHRTEIIFAVLIGAIFLHESLNFRVWVAAALAISGIALLYLDIGVWTQSLSLKVIAFTLASALSFGAAPTLTKYLLASGYHGNTLNGLRLMFLVVLLMMIPGVVTEALSYPLRDWLFCALVAACGPFGGRLCQIRALRYIPVSSVTLMSAAAPLITFMLQYWVFDIVPTLKDIGGALLILLAMIIVVQSTMVMRPSASSTLP